MPVASACSRSSRASPSRTTRAAPSRAASSSSCGSGRRAPSSPACEPTWRSDTIAVGTRGMVAGAESTLGRVPLFCRHNRFMADCPICSKGTVLEEGRSTPRGSSGPRTSKARPAAAATVKGPYGSAGPYSDDDGSYEVRLERGPGGLQLAAWAAGAPPRRAPVPAESDPAGPVGPAEGQGVLTEDDGFPAEPPAADGRSPGRAGELRDELRVERLDGGLLRIARWVMRPGRGWELQEAPVMLPAARFAEALASGAGAVTRPS